MEDATVLRIQLTPEELAALFQQGTNPDAEGPVAEILPDYSERERAVAIDVARRGLVAREFLEPDGQDGFSLHPLALGIVGCSMLSDETVAVSSETKAGESALIEFQQYQHEIYLAHTTGPEGLHEFDLFRDRATYEGAIVEAVRVADVGRPDCPEGVLPAELLGTSLERAAGDNGKIEAEDLRSAGLPEETSEQFAAALEHPFELKTITRISRADGEPAPGPELVLLQSRAGIWRLGDGKQGPGDPVPIRPLSRGETLAQLKDFLGY